MSAVGNDEPEKLLAGAGRSGYDLGRTLAFTDGVFAIAITLLVLTIPIPRFPGSPTNAELWRALLGQAPHLIGFAVSFYVVGAMWVAHHGLLRHLERVNRERC